MNDSSVNEIDWIDLKEGPCPHKQGEWTCYGNPANGPIICNMLDMRHIRDICPRFYRMCAIRDIAPNLWTPDVCCEEWRYLFLRCAEEGGGHLQGAFDLRLYPNDRKDVWRNYVRVRFTFCPFCGKPADPSPEALRQMWEEFKRSTEEEE